MNADGRLSNKEYEELSLEYEQNLPELSGQPGFFTTSPSEVIQYAIKEQLVENA